MRRLVDHWWLLGSTLVVGVIALTFALYAGESDREAQRQRRSTGGDLPERVVDDVLARELALARVVGRLGSPIGNRWPALSSIVISQPLANSTGFVQRVPERDRAAFARRTGLRLVETPRPGVLRPAARRPLHLVLAAYRQVGPGPPPLGLDIAGNALRRELLAQAARTGHQLATPPVQFLGRRSSTRGVVVYVPVRDGRGRLEGWVATAYVAGQLASTVTEHMPGVHLRIRDGAEILTSDSQAPSGSEAVIAVAGRRWSVWSAVPGSSISAVPWLVLSLGLTVTAAVMLILRQTATRTRHFTQQLALRDAEEAAVGQIATLVAQAATPDAVFTSVAEQVVRLFDARTGAVSRFDAATNRGIVLGGWTRDDQELVGAAYALDGVTASALVFRTGRGARKDAGYDSATDPISDLMVGLGGKDGVAAPIVVAGQLWGALGAAYGEHQIPVGVEQRLERFASLVGLAISNADAWERLAREASTDSLTGIPNRRAFHERLGTEAARARRYQHTLGLVLMDLDHFKAVNDRHGHQAGDRVLVAFAQLLSAHTRDGEMVARIGGEEFALLLPETDGHGAFAAADRIRRAIERTPAEPGLAVTVSAGVCSSENAHDVDTLVRNADRALYRAKESGRNATFLYTDEAGATLIDQFAAVRQRGSPD
ncbi:MAG: diguanylate cyclase [Actinomycetota bacterium]|nr:diguanylate cyclase [Actinomycetota bacterium]